MRHRTELAALAAIFTTLISACATAPTQPAPVEAWFKVAISSSSEAFVDTNAISRVGTLVDVRVKENYFTPRPAPKEGKTFQSARTDYRLDCAQRRVAMRLTEAFEGLDLQGNVVQKASRNDRNLIWMDAPRASVFGEILDYGCKNAPAAALGA
jgi:hypothetical protein